MISLRVLRRHEVKATGNGSSLILAPSRLVTYLRIILHQERDSNSTRAACRWPIES
jgi:hypothetical protein